ncbi:E3 ubiquitin-protein ligase mycbp2 [Branchiostoma belcheri]|nr:E3 ubiquitin-protein ligase mycbp2 [Branchiostoma belcheri]
MVEQFLQSQNGTATSQSSRGTATPQTSGGTAKPQSSRGKSHISEQQGNSHTPEQRRNSHTPEQQGNSQISEQRRNSHTPEQQGNSQISEQQGNSHTPQQRRNSHTPQQQRNSHILEQRSPKHWGKKEVGQTCEWLQPGKEKDDLDVSTVQALRTTANNPAHFAVLCARRMFFGPTLVSRNVRGKQGKLRLDESKVEKIQDYARRHYGLDKKAFESTWRNCRSRIDSWGRHLKQMGVPAEETDL